MLPDLKILFGVTVHGHTNREWFAECLRVFDCRFVGEDIPGGPRNSFRYVEAAAMEIPGRIEPCPIRKSGRFDYQSISVPVAT